MHECTTCNYKTSIKANYNRHIQSRKHLDKVKELSGDFPKYVCEACGYSTFVKGNYDKHILTKKHQRNVIQLSVDVDNSIIYKCKTCNYETSFKSKWDKHLSTSKHIKNQQKQEHITSKHQYNEDNVNVNNGNTVNKEETNDVINNIGAMMHMLSKSFTSMAESQLEFQKKTMEMHEKSQQNQLKLNETNANTQNNMIENVMSKFIDAMKDVKTNNCTINNTNNGTINNTTINVQYLNQHCPDTPSLLNYMVNALSEPDVIHMLKHGSKFRDIFKLKIIDPMRHLSYTERPLLLVRQKTKQRRKNLFVKTEEGWEDDSEKKAITTSVIDNAVDHLHINVKDKFSKEELGVTFEEYMDLIFNVREPKLTEHRTQALSSIFEAINSMEVDKGNLEH